MTIPKFGGLSGLLPTGEHAATWAEVETSLGFSGTRKEILEGLRAACHELRKAGVTHLFLDGSFATKKHHPSDWDACYSEVGVDPTAMDPVLLDYDNERKAMKAKYKGEVFIAEHKAGLLEPPYREFFQKCKQTGRRKGIVCLDLGTVP